jgi:hypothetical protein
MFEHHRGVTEKSGNHPIDFDGVVDQAAKHETKRSPRFVREVVDNASNRGGGNFCPKFSWDWSGALVFAQHDIGDFKVQHGTIVPLSQGDCGI